MMEGRDKDWIYLGNKRKITWSDLKPGNYTLKVKGSNNDGIWNQKGTSIKISVPPPLWGTWWFKIIGIFFIILVGFICYRIILKFRISKSNEKMDLDGFFSKFNISKRKQEIIQLMLKGKSNREIEEAFFISIKTVKSHIYNIYRKLGIKNRIELINLITNFPSQDQDTLKANSSDPLDTRKK